MGLLSEGSPLSWPETKALADHVRKHGVTQFINLFNRVQDRKGDILKWGDEVEYIVIKFDHEKKTAKVSLRAHEILAVLREKEEKDPDSVRSLWRPEYGAYMVEGTPGKPYGGLLAHFNVVEANMRYRREEAAALLQPGEALMSITSFPRLGCPGFTDPFHKPTPTEGSSRSLFLPDEVIFPGHPRFKTLTRNIRERRGEKVAINLPGIENTLQGSHTNCPEKHSVFLPSIDTNTPSPYVEDLSQYGDDGSSQKAALPDHVYLDAMGFGMGCCCLQVTFQACNISEARTLYDQLTPLCPILLALTAASPVHRGMLTDVDCRWNVISGSVDCRTRQERGLEPIPEGSGVRRIAKSRYDSIDSYLSRDGEKYNDVPLVMDENAYKQMIDAGIDHLLAQHIAHLFIRDSVSLFSEKVDQDDERDTDHFENIQSTNWQTMRFKPPPPYSPIGWRVEFRPCEAQLTDFENAAIVCFVVLLTRTILSFKLNMLIPISKVDENMQNAQKRNAAQTEKFWFRKNITTGDSPSCCLSPGTCKPDGECTLMTLDEIINGKEGEFPGLIPLVHNYLSNMDVDADSHCTIQQYLNLIQKRAAGKLLTTASWIRNQVLNHPEYKNDSVVSDHINYDLLKTMQEIQAGLRPCTELLGQNIITKTRDQVPETLVKAERC